MGKAQNQTVSLICGLVLLTVFSNPSTFLMWVSLALIALGSGLAYFISTGWVTSGPNEWMLIIENGLLKKAGVGLRTFKFWNQSVVTFPSTIQGVSFSAQQVTIENFGIEIQGVVYWSVYRDGEGPFKCYKYTQGANANENVKQVTESIVRSQISNTKLMNVLTKRIELREQVTKQLREQLEGWGIWAETVEITEVKICSQTTFKDMQTEFRFKHKQIAAQASQESRQTLDQERSKLELEREQSQSKIDTELNAFTNDQQIKRKEFSNDYEKKEREVKTEQLEQEKQLDLLRQDLEASKSLKYKENEIELTQMRKDQELQNKQAMEKIEDKMNARNIEILELDSTLQMYQNMSSLGEIRVNKYSGPSEFSNIGSQLPAMNMLNQALKQQQ